MRQATLWRDKENGKRTQAIAQDALSWTRALASKAAAQRI